MAEAKRSASHADVQTAMQICQDFIDGLADHILVIDPQYTILMANAAALGGRSRREVIGQPCYRVSHGLNEPCNMADSPCPVRETLRTSRPTRATHKHVDGRGNAVYHDIVASLINDADGQLLGVLESLRDVSHQVALEQSLLLQNAELEEARRRREEFTSAVSHELKGVVGLMSGYAQLLERKQREAQGDLDWRKFARTIISQSKRLNRLVEDMRDAASIETQRFVIQKQRTALMPVIRQAVDTQQSLTDKHVIFLDAPDDPLEGEWDGDRIAQVLDNLIGNAVKYSPSGGMIAVTVRRGPGEVVIAVRDQGLGISKAEIDHLFRPYARAHREIKGLGLGLYISKAIVEAHGGQIGVESREGQGSTFTMRLGLTKQPGTA